MKGDRRRRRKRERMERRRKKKGQSLKEKERERKDSRYIVKVIFLKFSYPLPFLPSPHISPKLIVSFTFEEKLRGGGRSRGFQKNGGRR